MPELQIYLLIIKFMEFQTCLPLTEPPGQSWWSAWGWRQRKSPLTNIYRIFIKKSKYLLIWNLYLLCWQECRQGLGTCLLGSLMSTAHVLCQDHGSPFHSELDVWVKKKWREIHVSWPGLGPIFSWRWQWWQWCQSDSWRSWAGCHIDVRVKISLMSSWCKKEKN